MAAPAALALAATDLERDDDEIAGRKIPHGVADIDHPAGGLVSEREGPGEPGLAADDEEIEIAARHRQRLHQRVAVIL